MLRVPHKTHATSLENAGSQNKVRLLEGVLDAAELGLIAIAPDGRIAVWNRWIARASSIPSKQASGKRLERLFPEIVNTRLETAVTAALTRGQSSSLSHAFAATSLPLVCDHQDRAAFSRMQQSIRVEPINIGDGQRHCLVHITDVTAIVQRERVLQEKAKRCQELADVVEARAQELTKSNEALGDFSYIVAHDLKEPLRGMRMYAQCLSDDYADRLGDSGLEQLQQIDNQGARLQDLIDALLEFSQVGCVDLALGETSIQGIVDEVLQSLRASLEEKGVSVRIPEELPNVYCDHIRIAEVFRNLITNALKYNDKDDPWIELSWHHASNLKGGVDDDAAIVFSARDNGIGIDEKHLESVFGVFKRLHEREAFGGGTGVGLAIVKKIVERHGGRIWVESEHGVGSCFHFSLPMKDK